MRGEFVDVRGTRLYYYATGTRGGGDPVVLLHGFPGSTHSWRAFASLLPEGRRVVVADLLGCGRSDGLGGELARTGSLAEHAALIRGLMADLQAPRVAFVGQGLGASIALRIALDAPDSVSALVLGGVNAWHAWPARLARLARLVRPAAGLLGPAVLASFVHGSALRGYADRDDGRRSLDQSLAAYGARLGLPPLLAHLAAMRDPDHSVAAQRLAALTVPVAIVWGADDPFLAPAVGRRLAAAIAGATIDVIPGARHFVFEDAPEQCARVACALLARGRG